MTPDETIAGIVVELRKTRKYRHLCDEALQGFAERAAFRFKRPGDALKAAKSRLHQSFGAYLDDGVVEKAEEALKLLYDGAEGEALRKACRAVLEAHASTAERLPFLSDFYQTIFSKTGRPHLVVDLACGLNPFALPWMGLPADCRYLAADADMRVVSLVDRLFARAGVHGEAAARDVLSAAIPDGADVVLLMKVLPLLEHQQEGAAEELLGRLDARRVVASFPTKSLGGREKGMGRNYAATWTPIFRKLSYRPEIMEFPAELVFVLKKE